MRQRYDVFFALGDVAALGMEVIDRIEWAGDELQVGYRPGNKKGREWC